MSEINLSVLINQINASMSLLICMDRNTFYNEDYAYFKTITNSACEVWDAWMSNGITNPKCENVEKICQHLTVSLDFIDNIEAKGMNA